MLECHCLEENMKHEKKLAVFIGDFFSFLSISSSIVLLSMHINLHNSERKGNIAKDVEIDHLVNSTYFIGTILCRNM